MSYKSVCVPQEVPLFEFWTQLVLIFSPRLRCNDHSLFLNPPPPLRGWLTPTQNVPPFPPIKQYVTRM